MTPYLPILHIFPHLSTPLFLIHLSPLYYYQTALLFPLSPVPEGCIVLSWKDVLIYPMIPVPGLTHYLLIHAVYHLLYILD